MELPRIQQLPRQLAHQIAAGEVVERPASVIKELLENAIDAQASRIRVDIDRGGIARMRVLDNGHGIHPDDLELVLERHSTSKLTAASDLSCVHSLGFRGEALGAIASVSRFRIETATDDNGQGMALANTDDGHVQIAPAAHRCGTTVDVRDLFYNTPVRRKFLRTEWTEYQHIQNVIRHIVLSHFDVDFTVYHNNRRVMHHPAAVRAYEQRVGDILGKSFLNNARYVDFSDGDLRLWGWLGDPEQARNQSDRQYVYLNSRMVRDKQVNHAIRIGYADRVYPGRYPGYVLYLEMAPQLADINVHPAKHEVRFRRARDVHDFIHAAVTRGLDRPLEQPASTTTCFSHARHGEQHWQVSEGNAAYEPLSHVLPSDRTTPLGLLRTVIQNRYAIFENDSGMTLLDVFAARQRLAEMALRNAGQGVPCSAKLLLFPAIVNAVADELDTLESRIEDYHHYGVMLARQGHDQIALRALPVVLQQADPEHLLNDILAMSPCPGRQEIPALLLQHVNDKRPALDADAVHELVDQLAIEDTVDNAAPVWRQLDDSALLKLLSP